MTGGRENVKGRGELQNRDWASWLEAAAKGDRGGNATACSMSVCTRRSKSVVVAACATRHQSSGRPSFCCLTRHCRRRRLRSSAGMSHLLAALPTLSYPVSLGFRSAMSAAASRPTAALRFPSNSLPSYIYIFLFF